MATTNTPKYVLRNFDLWTAGKDQIGQSQEAEIPTLKVKTEDMRNAGMVKPREVNLGYEKLEMKFKMTSLYDPTVMALWGLAPGVTNTFLVAGALFDEDGTEHSFTGYMTGFMKQVQPEPFEAGSKKHVNTYEVAVHTIKLAMDGAPLVQIDDFNVIIGGVNQTAGIAAALLQ